MATPSLLKYRRGQGIVNPDICGSVWRSHWSKGSHGKGVQIGFLLLIHNRRNSSSVTTHSTYHTLVAIAKVAHRHSGTANNSTRKLQICSGSSRVFHKMGRSEAFNQYSDIRAKKIFLAEHNMLVQSTQRDNSRQCQAI
jgi:hypothetical protein